MLGSNALEVAIGLAFVFLLVSIVCSALREGLEAWLKTRSAYLEYWIAMVLRDGTGPRLVERFYKHPLIDSLFVGDYEAKKRPKPWLLSKGRDLPTYIPARSFALALMDVVSEGPAPIPAAASRPALSVERLRTNVERIENERLQRALILALDRAEGDINRVQRELETWFDSSMEHVSGWYKGCTQWIIFGFGVLVAVTMNVNAIRVAEHLYRDPTARAAIVAEAEKAAQSDAPPTKGKAAKEAAESLPLPIGWSGPSKAGAWRGLFMPLLGWLVTALAATMGAPFWFDMVNKLVSIRSTTKPRDATPSPDATNAATPPAQRVAESVPAVEGEHAEGCGLGIGEATRDEDLPAAMGGVEAT